jgi:hypothetical protein
MWSRILLDEWSLDTTRSCWRRKRGTRTSVDVLKRDEEEEWGKGQAIDALGEIRDALIGEIF